MNPMLRTKDGTVIDGVRMPMQCHVEDFLRWAGANRVELSMPPNSGFQYKIYKDLSELRLCDGDVVVRVCDNQHLAYIPSELAEKIFDFDEVTTRVPSTTSLTPTPPADNPE